MQIVFGLSNKIDRVRFCFGSGYEHSISKKIFCFVTKSDRKAVEALKTKTKYFLFLFFVSCKQWPLRMKSIFMYWNVQNSPTCSAFGILAPLFPTWHAICEVIRMKIESECKIVVCLFLTGSTQKCWVIESSEWIRIHPTAKLCKFLAWHCLQVHSSSAKQNVSDANT